MAYSIEIREEVLRKIKNGCSIKMVSSEYGISTATICRWKIAKEQDNNEVAIENKITETRVEEISKNEEVSQPFSVQNKKAEIDMKALSQEIARLTKSGEFQEALNLCKLGSFNRLIQHQNVLVLIKMAKNMTGEERDSVLKEAIAICDKNIKNREFISLKQRIAHEFPTFVFENPLELEISNDDKEVIKNMIAKIYCDFVTEEEIKNSNIDPWCQNILLIAYYDKVGRATKLFLAKKLKEENKDDEQKVKFLNRLIEKFSRKKNNYFDLVIYTNYLHCSLDYKLVQEFEKEKQLREQRLVEVSQSEKEKVCVVTERKVVEERKPEKEKTPKKIVSVVGQRVNPRYQQVSSFDSTLNNQQELLIKDVFANEIFEIGKQVYIQMYNPENRMRGMDAWDRLEALKMRSADDIWALRSMINLIDRINLKDPGLIKTNDERNAQLIKKVKEKQKSKKL